MNKSVSFDLSADRLVQTAENLIDSRDYLGALKILNKMRSATATRRTFICCTLRFSTIWDFTNAP